MSLTADVTTPSRSMVAEFGPTSASRYPVLAGLSDSELLEYGDLIVAVLRQMAERGQPAPVSVLVAEDECHAALQATLEAGRR